MSILPSPSDSDIKSDTDWENYRQKNFPIVNNWAYFDHAAVSPLSQPAHKAIEKWLGEASHEGDTVWPNWAAKLEEIRKTAAVLVNAQPAEIAFVPSTSFGISTVAEGLDWRPGDNVVIPAGEFPSNLYPWMNLQSRGVELRTVEIDSSGRFSAEQIDAACDSNTRLVSASWVGFASGYRICPKELAEVAHAHDAYFFLDAIQGLGVFPLDVAKSGVDFFAADGHKWLMGPEGAGLFFCRQELLERIHPRIVGWNSVQTSYDFSKIEFNLKNSAARFEAGTQNMAGILGMGGSLELIASVGVNPNASPIAERVVALTDYLQCELDKIGWNCKSPRNENEKSGIISFAHPDQSPVESRKKLLANRVVTSVRNDCLRFSPHAYINQSDIDRAVSIMRND